MSDNDLSKDDALNLLQETKFELERCRKSLVFKENLLLDLESEVSDLTLRNEQLQRDLEWQRLQEHRKKSSEQENSPNKNVHNRRESCSPEALRGNICGREVAGPSRSSAPCESCRLSDVEKVDLMNTIEELHDEKERLSDANQRLLRNLNSKTAQLDEVVADVSKEKALRRTLEASLEYLTVEKELIERDLRDFRESSLQFPRLSGVTTGGLSFGSSLGDELGFNDARNCGERKLSLPFNWNVDIGEPEMDDFPVQQVQQGIIEGRVSDFENFPGDARGLPWERDEQAPEQIKSDGKSSGTEEARQENSPDDHSETNAAGMHKPSATSGWRSLVCVPYRRLLKRRRL